MIEMIIVNSFRTISVYGAMKEQYLSSSIFLWGDIHEFTTSSLKTAKNSNVDGSRPYPCVSIVLVVCVCELLFCYGCHMFIPQQLHDCGQSNSAAVE